MLNKGDVVTLKNGDEVVVSTTYLNSFRAKGVIGSIEYSEVLSVNDEEDYSAEMNDDN